MSKFIIGEIYLLEIGKASWFGKESCIVYYISTYIKLTYELQFLHMHCVTDLVTTQVDDSA